MCSFYIRLIVTFFNRVGRRVIQYLIHLSFYTVIFLLKVGFRILRRLWVYAVCLRRLILLTTIKQDMDDPNTEYRYLSVANPVISWHCWLYKIEPRHLFYYIIPYIESKVSQTHLTTPLG